MTYLISGDSADEVWKKAFSLVIDEGEKDDSRAGACIELLNVSLFVETPSKRWVQSRYPRISPAFAVAEVFWILSGSNCARFINFWNPALPRFSGNVSKYHGAYGYRLRHYFGSDQILNAYHALASNCQSRQVVMNIYSCRSDFPNDEGRPAAADIPCNICSMLKVRDGKLHWSQILRSNDLIFGVPYNFIQFTTIQEIMAGWLGCDVGGYSHYTHSLHVYEHDLPSYSVRSLPTTTFISSGDLRLPFVESLGVISKCFEILESLTKLSSASEEVSSIIEKFKTLPLSYQEFLSPCLLYAFNKCGLDAAKYLLSEDIMSSTPYKLWYLWHTKF
jgi:thymidylate synthase